MNSDIDPLAYENLKRSREFVRNTKQRRLLALIAIILSLFFLYISLSIDEVNLILLIITVGFFWLSIIILKSAFSKPNFVQYATVCKVLEQRRSSGNGDGNGYVTYYYYKVMVNGKIFEQKCDSVNQDRRLFEEGDEVIVWKSGSLMPIIVKR